jgi:putative transposase
VQSTTIRRCYKYRLYPGPDQAERLTQILDCCRELYNAALEERREAYRRCGVFVTCAQQQAQLPAIKEVRPEYREIGSQVLQDVLQRLDRAFGGFFRRLKAGQAPGFPRFKGHERYHSFTYKQTGWKLADGRLVLSRVGAIKVKWSRPIEGTIKTVTIRRDADQWYVCFSCVVAVERAATPNRPALGIDMGLEHFATLSTGMQIANPRYLRQGQALLTRRQQALSRKKRGSKRRKKARLLVAKAHRNVRNRRHDFHHKTALAIVAQAGALAVESLNTANMVKNHALAKSISDAGWAQFLAILKRKAAEAGLVMVAVHPSGTSQACSGCGAITSKTLADRWHTCAVCGLSLHRDHNAALNILHRAGLAPQAHGLRIPRLEPRGGST